jgi:hypothetical protein
MAQKVTGGSISTCSKRFTDTDLYFLGLSIVDFLFRPEDTPC